MRQLTVRGITPSLAECIRRLSVDEGISLNKAALRLLAQGAGLGGGDERSTVIGPDLDHLFGTWTDEEANAFLESIRSCEQVDAGFWT